MWQASLRRGKGGEVSPKEAVQLVAKELLAYDLRSVLDDVIVLVLRLVNPDGGDVRRRTIARSRMNSLGLHVQSMCEG